MFSEPVGYLSIRLVKLQFVVKVDSNVIVEAARGVREKDMNVVIMLVVSNEGR